MSTTMSTRWSAAAFATPQSPMLSTIDLLDRFKNGDQDALNLLVQRCVPALRQWARGRLSQRARRVAETQDVVQAAVLSALPHLHTFVPRGPGALQGYLREAVRNRIIDIARSVVRHPDPVELVDEHADHGPSPLTQAVGRERLEQMRAALAKLKPAEREAIVAKFVQGRSLDEVAKVLGKPTANAARMAVSRAVKSLRSIMGETA
jgi:RNA polymerase sigma factor (sigma-70 family)